MGMYSNLGVFSDAQDIAAAGASTNTIDLKQTYPKIGVGQHAPYLCVRLADPSTTEADSMSIELQCDADDGAGEPAGVWGTVVMMFCCAATGAEITGTDARLSTAGAWIFRGQLPYDIAARHIRLYYNNTASTEIITIDAWLSDGPNSTFRGSQVLTSPVGNP